MPPSERDPKPLWIRLASRTAGLIGVRFYNMLYGERSLIEYERQVEPPSGLQIRRAAGRDLQRLQQTLPRAQAEPCRIAAEHQSRCFVAVDGPEIAGYSWLDTRHIYLLGRKLRALPPEVGYTYNSFVRPDFRGRKIFQCLTEAVYSELAHEGYQFCCNLVDRHNAPSVAARRRLGAQFCAAPILELPGFDPFPLRRLPFGVTTRESTSRRA